MSEKLTWQQAILQLKDRGIKQLKVFYEGSGDSGSIDSIEYYNGEEEDEIIVGDLDSNAIMNLCYPMLDDIEDWYNNDGGFGFITINLEDFSYEITNNIRYTNHETYSHEGTLDDYIKE